MNKAKPWLGKIHLNYDINIFSTSKIGGVDEFYRCSRMAIPHNCSN